MSKVIVSNNKALLKQNGRVIVDLDLPADYIQDGLVFYLDGIDKGEDNNYWTDIVGGVKFKYNEHSIKENDGIRFDGEGLIKADRAFSVSHRVGTIEVAYKDRIRISGSIVLYPILDTDLGFMHGSQGISYWCGSPNNQYQVSHPSKGTVSIRDGLAICNGVELTTKTTNIWAYRSSVMLLGGRETGNHYYLKETVCSIRIYNRFLTEQEMFHNQKIDNERFNLGLSI